MEITTVHYRRINDVREQWSGDFYVNPAGVVLLLSVHSQLFVPWHKVDNIEQSFTSDIEFNERMNKSLTTRLSRIGG